MYKSIRTINNLEKAGRPVLSAPSAPSQQQEYESMSRASVIFTLFYTIPTNPHTPRELFRGVLLVGMAVQDGR